MLKIKFVKRKRYADDISKFILKVLQINQCCKEARKGIFIDTEHQRILCFRAFLRQRQYLHCVPKRSVEKMTTQG